jgi:hypothetical protein
MGKGDIKLEVKGNVDFLTDFPQVSFFDVLYKRHTNFATEMIYLPISGSLEFGETLTCVLPRSGDLVHKMYLAVTLSEVNIPRKSPFSGLSRQTAKDNYSTLLNFLNLLYPVYRNIVSEQQNINFNISDIISILNTILTSKAYTDIQGTTVYNNIYGSHYDFVQEFSTYSDPTQAFDSTTGYLKLDKFNNFIKLTTNYDKLLYDLTKEFSQQNNYYFAWKDQLGHRLIQQIDLEIGGQKIDRQFTDWLNIWEELTISINSLIRPTYDKMIGNIDILTKYNGNAKPQYQLLIPLQFFFNRYLECCLPIVFFRYHDVKIIIQLNNLFNIAQIDPQLSIDNVNIDDYVKITDVRLLTEFIYLDQDERVKFATYAHEYLVDYVQEYNVDIISQTQTINFDFFNSVKSLYFVIQSYQSLNFNNYAYNTNIVVTGKITSETLNNALVTIFILDDAYVDQLIIDSSYIGKTISFTNTKYYNNTYTITAINNQQFTFNGTYEGDDNATLIYTNFYPKGPLNTFELLFESYTRQKQLDGDYLNYVIPSKSHRCIPGDGIYQYAFSISPEDYQPSGSCNFSALRYKSMILNLTDDFWNYASQYDGNGTSKAKLTIYGLTYNILRLANGMGALYFSA